MQARSFLVLLALASSACACAGGDAARSEVPPAPTAAELAARRGSALRQQAEAAWAERGDEGKLRSAIAAWEALAELEPSDSECRARLARAHYFLAEAFLRDEQRRDEQLVTLERGVSWGEQAIRVGSPGVARRLDAGESLEAAVEAAEAASVPALYWYGANLGRWARTRGIAELLGKKDRVEAVMRRVLALDEGYFHAAPHRYFGAYLALLPSIAGRDVERSREHFERSLALAPGWVGTRVLFADTYCVKTQDRARFEALLREVLATPDDALPELVPETRVEKAKAAALLAAIDDYF